MKTTLIIFMLCNAICYSQVVPSKGQLVSAQPAYSQGSAVQQVTFINLKKVVTGAEKIPDNVKAYIGSKDLWNIKKSRNVYLLIEKKGEKWVVMNYWVSSQLSQTPANEEEAGD